MIEHLDFWLLLKSRCMIKLLHDASTKRSEMDEEMPRSTQLHINSKDKIT